MLHLPFWKLIFRRRGNGGKKKEINGEKAGDGKKEAEAVQKVAYHKLFTSADKQDIVLMKLGSLGAMDSYFGPLVESFGSSDPSHVVNEVPKVTKP
ncbi:hypothetical protein AB3S75_005113 [Citrus x aurantiifolia]